MNAKTLPTVNLFPLATNPIPASPSLALGPRSPGSSLNTISNSLTATRRNCRR